MSKMLLILGTTASGKGRLAYQLARRLGGEIISVDSMKVYRGMDIGTNKPSRRLRSAIPHFLVDVAEPWESFSLGRFVELADAVIASLRARQRPIIAVGGTSMYLRGLLEGIFEGPSASETIRQRIRQEAAAEHGLECLHQRLREVDPAAAERIHVNDLKRIMRALEVFELTGQPISHFQRQFRSGEYRHPWTIIGVRRSKEEESHRINQRVKQMLEQGLLDEVKRLLAHPAGLSPQASVAVGYAEIIAHLRGQLSLEDALEQIKINTRRLAKAQRTWFRSFLRVNWFEVQPEETAEDLAQRVLETIPQAD